MDPDELDLVAQTSKPSKQKPAPSVLAQPSTRQSFRDLHFDDPLPAATAEADQHHLEDENFTEWEQQLIRKGNSSVGRSVFRTIVADGKIAHPPSLTEIQNLCFSQLADAEKQVQFHLDRISEDRGQIQQLKDRSRAEEDELERQRQLLAFLEREPLLVETLSYSYSDAETALGELERVCGFFYRWKTEFQESFEEFFIFDLMIEILEESLFPFLSTIEGIEDTFKRGKFVPDAWKASFLSKMVG